MDCSMPGFLVLHCLPEFAQTHVRWVSDTIQPSHPLSSPLTPAFNLSQHQGLFQWVTSSYQVEKCWSLTISPSNEHSGLISFRMDWFDLLASPRVFSSLLQSQSEASVVELKSTVRKNRHLLWTQLERELVGPYQGKEPRFNSDVRGRQLVGPYQMHS